MDTEMILCLVIVGASIGVFIGCYMSATKDLHRKEGRLSD